MAGNEQVGFDLVKACKEACAAANVLLKVIIENGELKDEALIRKASEISIKAGADFIKTSHLCLRGCTVKNVRNSIMPDVLHSL